MSREKYFVEGTIKKLDIGKSIINITSKDTVSNNIVSDNSNNDDSDDSKKNYNLWIKEDGSETSKEKACLEKVGRELPKEAILLKSDVNISYFDEKNEFKSTLIKIALENKKAKFYISEKDIYINNKDSYISNDDSADYKLVNLVICNG